VATVAVYNTEGKEVEKLEISDNIFGVEINENLMHKAVVAFLANRRQGTQSALTRSEVRGGGRKPWRQKGTGHARQGSIRAPQWTGGGVVFAPKPRDYSQKINKKEARLALFSALTSKVQDNKLIVVDELSMEAPKTKNFVTILGNLKADKALVVTENADKNVVLSARNIPDVKTEARAAINVYDILKHDSLVITKDAVKALEEVYA
jgi:large subunit ribosomal protein L4